MTGSTLSAWFVAYESSLLELLELAASESSLPRSPSRSICWMTGNSGLCMQWGRH